MGQRTYFVGTKAEVAHHAAPLVDRIDYEIAEPNIVLERAQKGDLAVFYSEHFDRFRDCVVKLKEMGVATLYMIDGILEWRNAWENRPDEPACPWTMRPVLAHKVACIGHSQMAILNSWGNSEKTELVGVPRFDRLRDSTTENELVPNGGSKDSSIFRVLVMSAKCPGFTEVQVENCVRGFQSLRNWFQLNSVVDDREVELVWRLTGDLSDRLGVESRCADLTGIELESEIRSVDAVITTPSTAMLEAMLLDRPVALIDFNNTPQWVPAAWTITSNDHIQDVINELAAPSARRLAYQKDILDSALLPTADASERMAQLITRMLDHASSCNPLSFPIRMLSDLPVTGKLSFEHRELYPEIEDFENRDMVELQVQLAHSRREIEHLQGELAQLKSELGQAHEIFDQIHRHPVAGPIVRIRQKLIDWIARNRGSASVKPPASSMTHNTSTNTTASP